MLVIRFHLRVGMLLVLLSMLFAATAGAQTRMLADAPGTWKPWKPFAAAASARQEQAATPALVKAFEDELLALNAILRRAPGVAAPVGFSVETWGSLASYRSNADAPGQPAAGAQPLAGGLTFGAFPIFEYQRNGKTVREDTGETALQQFLVNQIARGIVDRTNVPEWGAIDHDAFLQPPAQGEIAGLPRFGDVLILARDPAALWAPLSRRAALELVVKARQSDLKGFQESAAAHTARLAIVRDPAWQARRIKDAQQAAAAMPNPQTFIKQIEESIRVEESSLLRELDPAAGGKGLANARRALDEVTGLIAELPAADLAAAACYDAKGATIRTRFRSGPAATCVPIVRPNYGYFSKALPRSAPQVLIITGINRCFDTMDKNNRDANSTSPAGCRANRALIESVDKSALRAWIR